MPLLSPHKNKGLILRVAGIMVLLSLLFSFAVIPQPATASTSSLGITMSVDPSVTCNNNTIEFSITIFNLAMPGASNVDFDLYFTPPDATGNIGATEYQLNHPGGGTNRIHLNVGDSVTYTSSTPWVPPANLPPQNGDKLSHILNLNPNVTQAWGSARFNGMYENFDLATGSQTVHVDVIWPSPGGGPVAPPPAISVGGIAVFPVDGSDSSSPPYAAIIGGAMATLAALALGIWFARRRWQGRCS